MPFLVAYKRVHADWVCTTVLLLLMTSESLVVFGSGRKRALELAQFLILTPIGQIVMSVIAFCLILAVLYRGSELLTHR